MHQTQAKEMEKSAENYKHTSTKQVGTTSERELIFI